MGNSSGKYAAKKKYRKVDWRENKPRIQTSVISEKKIFLRALYSFEPTDSNDLAFMMNDLLFAMEDIGNNNWFKATNNRTKEIGLVPLNFVRIEDGSPTSYEYYYDVNRVQAERLLQMMSNPPGTFLIRPSTNKPNLALSVRIKDSCDVWTVKHFVINFLGDKWSLNASQSFDTVADLISYYKKENIQYQAKLIQPLPRNQKPPLHFQQMEVNRINFHKIEVVGNGNFGEVWKARWGCNSNNFVAIKCIKCNKMSNEDFLAEAKVIHSLRHPRIVELLGICTFPKSEPIYIITEYMEEGSLLNFLHSSKGKSLQFKNLIDMIAQVSEGMEYLECHEYLHRDLRAANILVDSNWFVKVADFGLAGVMQNDGGPLCAKGTNFPVRWTAPEAGMHGVFSIKSDVWSFGILIYETITYGRNPYDGIPTKEIFQKLLTNYRMENPEGPDPDGHTITCPKILYNIMLQCWDKDPKSRPTFSSLVNIFGDWGVTSEGNYGDN